MEMAVLNWWFDDQRLVLLRVDTRPTWHAEKIKSLQHTFLHLCLQSLKKHEILVGVQQSRWPLTYLCSTWGTVDLLLCYVTWLIYLQLHALFLSWMSTTVPSAYIKTAPRGIHKGKVREPYVTRCHPETPEAFTLTEPSGWWGQQWSSNQCPSCPGLLHQVNNDKPLQS